jgi:drug/metabolite transporter (DMT)-like permease
MGERLSFPPNVALVLSIIAVSTASILIRMSHAPPIVIAMYRMVFSTLILLPYFLFTGGINKVRKIGLNKILFLISIGVFLAIHFASWITSLSFTSVASSVVFVHIDPIFVSLISHYFLKEPIQRRTVIGIVIAIFGATIIAVGDAGIGELNLYGDFLAFIGGVMLGIYIIGGRILRKELDLTSYVTPVYATAAIVLGLGTIAMGEPLTGYPSDEYLLFFIIALVPMIFGHTVYNWALKYVTAPIVSISLLGEPVGASFLAYLILKESPNRLVIFGGIVTLLGILISVFQAE